MSEDLRALTAEERRGFIADAVLRGECGDLIQVREVVPLIPLGAILVCRRLGGHVGRHRAGVHSWGEPDGEE